MTHRAKFPFLRTIEEFDFMVRTGLRKELLGSYLGPEFVPEGRSLLHYGPSGTGKTHVAIVVAYKAIQHGSDARFVTAAHLIDELSSASRDSRRPADSKGSRGVDLLTGLRSIAPHFPLGAAPGRAKSHPTRGPLETPSGPFGRPWRVCIRSGISIPTVSFSEGVAASVARRYEGRLNVLGPERGRTTPRARRQPPSLRAPTSAFRRRNE
jgi:hypothetical protein